MLNLSNIITRIKKPKTRMSIVMMILVLSFSTHAFAQTTNNTNGMETLAKTLDDVVKLCSRLRIVLAGLAGKVMTNDWVYGSIFHMDQYLWNLWNICKNFANFGLLALILVGIAKHIFGKGDSPAKIIQKTLITGILIQASWFLLGATLDISTIATQTIASFPNTYITNSDLNNNLQTELSKGMGAYTLTIAPNNQGKETKSIEITENKNELVFREKILPKYDSLGGPLMFIGLSALRIQDYMDLSTKTDLTAKNISLNFALKCIILVMFVLIMAFLVIANVMRMGYLRIIIPLSPIFILLRTMGKDMMGKGSKDSFFSKLNVSTVFLMIFKPVIFAAVISFILLFVLTMQKIMMKPGNVTIFDYKGVQVGTTNDNTAVMSTPGNSISITDSTFKSTTNGIQNFFANMILSLATLFLMRILIKVALTTGGGPIEDAMTGMTKRVEKAAKDVPIFPGGYGRNASGKGFNTFTQKLGDTIDIDLNTKSGTFGERQDAASAFENRMRAGLGMEYQVLTPKKIKELSRLSEKKGDGFLTDTRDSFKELNQAFVINENGQWKTLFESWLQTQDPNSLKDMHFRTYGPVAEGESHIDAFFKKDENRKAFHALMGATDNRTPETAEIFSYKYGK